MRGSPSDIWEIAISADGSLAWVTQGYGDVYVIGLPAMGLITTHIVGGHPRSNPALAGGNVFFTDGDGGHCFVFTEVTHAYVGTVYGFTYGWACCATPDQSKVYVADYSAGDVKVIDVSTLSIVATVPSGPGVSQLAATPDGAHIWCSCQQDGTIRRIRTSDDTQDAVLHMPTTPTTPGPSIVVG